MIRAVFFDLYNTLAGFRPPRYEIQATACAAFGLRPTEEGVVRGYAVADAYMAEQNALRAVRTLNEGARSAFFAEYERRILAGAGIEVDPQRAAEIWRRVREVPYELERFDDVLPALSALRARGLALGVISNIDRRGDALVAQLGLEPHLDFTLTSGDVGVEKPHPPIFLAALERAAVAAREAVHVGDQLTSDVEGARAVGIHPVLLDRDGNHGDIADCARIETLLELADLLDSPERLSGTTGGPTSCGR